MCPALKASAQELEYVSSTLYHNLYRGIGRIGDYVYCGGPYGIHIFDISDPLNPVLAGNYDSIFVSRLYIDGNYAYAIGTSPGLWIFDVSNPLNPQLASSSSFSPGILAYYDHTFYNAITYIDSIGAVRSNIYVVDVSDPYGPVVSEVLNFPYVVDCIWAGNGFLQVYEHEFDYWYNAWAVFSLADPAHPYLNNYLDLGMNYVFGLGSYGNYAYLDFLDEVRIYDFSTSYEPTLVRIDISGNFPNLIVTADSIGYAWADHGIKTYNMSDPVYPIQMGYANISDDADFFAYHGDTCFTTTINSVFDDDESKFDIIDFTNLYNPSVIGEYWSPGNSYDIQIRGDYAFIANGAAGIMILDISIPEEPEIREIFEFPIAARDLYIDDNRLYLLSNNSRFSIYELSETNQLARLGYIDNYYGETRNFYIDGNYAYLTKDIHNNPEGDCVLILDISDPSNPVIADTIGYFNNPNYIVVDNGFAFLTTSDGIRIYDVSNLDSISMVSLYPYQNYGFQIAVEYPYLYMACSNTAMEIIDISDPANPQFIGAYDSLSSKNISLFENYALLKKYNALYLMDISNPQNPSLLSSYSIANIWSTTEEVCVFYPYLYVPAYNRLEILRITPTGIEEVSIMNLSNFSLPQNYPNPFNASTTISYSLPQPADVRIEIFDILGRRVETLFSGPQQAGEHTFNWRPGDISSGVYYYRIGSGDFHKSKSCLLIK